jgi:glutaminyl-peptide cyclotransferase
VANFPFSILLSVLLAGTPASPEFLHSSSKQQAKTQQRGFDAAKAYAALVKQTQFGSREPGSPGHERCLKYLQEELGKYADIVLPQSFSYSVPNWKRAQLTNLMASFNVRSTNRMFISAHWDTRPWADQDPEKKNRTKPIIGANDGASGVAVILEIARVLRQVPPSIGVDLVLFDGEDLGKSGVGESFSVGAEHFAKNRPAGFAPRFGINIDMIGDKNLEIEREQNSEKLAPEIQSLVFSTARRLMLSGFIDRPGHEISDDHLPMNGAGIPTVDLIDFNYPDGSNRFWHTLADTPDKCSAESLGAVGTLLLEIIYTQQ